MIDKDLRKRIKDLNNEQYLILKQQLKRKFNIILDSQFREMMKSINKKEMKNIKDTVIK